LNLAGMRAEFERAVKGRTRAILATFGTDVQRLREDSALSRAALARAAGLDASYLAEVEGGVANPSLETCARLSLGLGADFPLRLYPTTGPAVRDRHQSAIAEVTLASAASLWARFPEIAVRHPARGWIDIGLHDPRGGVFVATEIQSELRRIEQLIRWSEEKASALPSWNGWAHLGDEPEISRLLIVRETRTNRATAEAFRRLLRAAYPADGRDALAALTGHQTWPGAAIIWAARDRAGGGYRLTVRH
jgi:transcriptional regulator with XRE-family HTH domain